MRYRPINSEPQDRRLDRHIPDDFDHVERWPLTITTTPTRPVPVVIGVNWYSNFDEPEQDSKGRYWIGRGNLGAIRGGHCICIEPGDQADPAGHRIGPSIQDTVANWGFYDQGSEGACVGFGCSRMMTLLNRRRYFARWLWDRAKDIDEWPDTKPGDDNGTSVRAGLEILRARGHVVWQPSFQAMNDEPGDAYPRSQLRGAVGEGITAYRWATSVEQVHAALQSPTSDRAGAVRLLQSWGVSWPHRVWLPDETLQRLLDEQGECGVVTDR